MDEKDEIDPQLSQIVARFEERDYQRTSAQVEGIDNGWNLLHIASGIMAALMAKRGYTVDADFEHCAQDSIRGADALLRVWRKSQGEDRDG